MTQSIRNIELTTGVRLQYAERGTGTPVLLLHGYSDSWYSYASVLDQLDDRVHAFALTQRGHGDAGKPQEGYDMADFAADALAFLDAQGLDRVAVVGHSMGTFIAQELALSQPERVSHLILIGSAPRGDNEVLAGLAEAVADLQDPVDGAFIREFQASTVHTPIPDDVLDTICAESSKMPARVWRQVLAGLRAYDAKSQLASISAKTLLLWGDCDTVFSRAEQDELRAAIPGATLAVYQDIGHGLHWEAPRRVADQLAAFVSRFER